MSKKIVQIPPGFKDLLQDFTIAVLKESPDDVVDFAIDYFTSLKESHEENHTDNESIHSDEEDDSMEPLRPPPQRGVRRVAVAGESFDPEAEDDDDDEEKTVFPKTDEQRNRLNNAVKHILLFRCLEEEQLNDVINAMFERKCEPEDVVITQGDDGDNFYVIESGVFDIFVKINGVNTKVGAYDNQGSFGELALMYNAPRAATIVCSSAGTIWAMDRGTFRKLVLKKAFQKRRMYENLLDSVPLLKELNSYERMSIADALKSRTYQEGEKIISQGDEGFEMYFVEEGACRVTRRTGHDGEEVEISTIDKGGYFGELALLTKQPRAANVYATTSQKCKVAVLDVGSFERLLGPCLNIMRRSIDSYQQQLVSVFGSLENVPDLRAD